MMYRGLCQKNRSWVKLDRLGPDMAVRRIIGDQRRGVEIAFIEGDGQAGAIMANKGKAVFCQGVCRVRQKARGQKLNARRR